MTHYLRADLFKLYKEKRMMTSLLILLLLSLLTAFLFIDSKSVDNTSSILQVLTQFIPLFFLVPTNFFFGDDFANRTINNIIIKKQTRYPLFCYKTLITVFFNYTYVLIAYISTAFFRLLLHGRIDLILILKTFFQQLPIITCISLLCITLFIAFNRLNHAYLTYILLCLLADNISQLILSNLLHLNIPSDYFLFLALQNTEAITSATILISILFSFIYLVFSYHLFSTKALK